MLIVYETLYFFVYCVVSILKDVSNLYVHSCVHSNHAPCALCPIRVENSRWEAAAESDGSRQWGEGSVCVCIHCRTQQQQQLYSRSKVSNGRPPFLTESLVQKVDKWRGTYRKPGEAALARPEVLLYIIAEDKGILLIRPFVFKWSNWEMPVEMLHPNPMPP